MTTKSPHFFLHIFPYFPLHIASAFPHRTSPLHPLIYLTFLILIYLFFPPKSSTLPHMLSEIFTEKMSFCTICTHSFFSPLFPSHLLQLFPIRILLFCPLSDFRFYISKSQLLSLINYTGFPLKNITLISYFSFLLRRCLLCALYLRLSP